MENKKPRVKKTTIDDKIKNAISKILNVQRPIGVNISYTSKRIRFVDFVQETEKKVTTKISTNEEIICNCDIYKKMKLDFKKGVTKKLGDCHHIHLIRLLLKKDEMVKKEVEKIKKERG